VPNNASPDKAPPYTASHCSTTQSNIARTTGISTPKDKKMPGKDTGLMRRKYQGIAALARRIT